MLLMHTQCFSKKILFKTRELIGYNSLLHLSLVGVTKPFFRSFFRKPDPCAPPIALSYNAIVVRFLAPFRTHSGSSTALVVVHLN